MIKLNLGCGPHAMQGWLNYDLEWNGRRDVVTVDLSRGRLAHADETVDYIFSEHFIEHITRVQAQALLKECHRVLKPGGVIRISTPDLSHLIDRYSSGKLWRLPGVWEPLTLCRMVNEGMREWGHQFLYDNEELRMALRAAGFTSVIRKGWKSSGYPELNGLEVRTNENDLIVEATKGIRFTA